MEADGRRLPSEPPDSSARAAGRIPHRAPGDRLHGRTAADDVHLCRLGTPLLDQRGLAGFVGTVQELLEAGAVAPASAEELEPSEAALEALR